jgi:thymidylate synthase (FAD)
MQVKIISKTENAFDKIDKQGSKTINLVTKVLKQGHTGILEHCNITFAISGVSRALSHQLVRHRHMSFCQQSQRSVNMNGFDYVVPESVKAKPELMKMYEVQMLDLNDCYRIMIEQGIPQEDARYILPNACTTNLTVTTNLRELKHFLSLRLCSKAQLEARQLAELMRAETVKRYGWLDEFLQPKCVEAGKCTENKPCGRV